MLHILCSAQASFLISLSNALCLCFTAALGHRSLPHRHRETGGEAAVPQQGTRRGSTGAAAVTGPLHFLVRGGRKKTKGMPP